LEKADILIKGCTILPINREDLIEDGLIAIKNNKITFIGKRETAPAIKADIELDAKKKAAIPGLINCHTHVSMTLFRGVAEDKSLEKWLKDSIWPLEAKLKPNDVYAGALLGCLEMVKSGTTCFADMYFHENMVAKAVEKSGLRAVLAEGIIEAGDKAKGEKMLKQSLNFATKFDGSADGRIKTMLGPHTAYSCSQELLEEISEKASETGVGVHLHLAESKTMFKKFEEMYGCSETEFLEKIGFFKNHVLAAHCIDLSKKDMRILSKNGVHVAHVPVANMKLGLGAAKIVGLMRLGVNVGFGTDGPASNNSLDLFETVKFGALLQKLVYQDPAVLSAYEALKMATAGGAKALGLEGSVGSLEVGKKADIVLVDLSKPHLKPLHNIYASIVYSARGGDVDTVIVNGKVVMENRQVKILDEEFVMEKAEEAALNLLDKR
jgi:5-methylthioadenosine/S-adenosylhomocysteine deaminase